MGENFNYLKESAAAINEIIAESNAREHKRMANMLKESQDRYDKIQFYKEHHEFLRDRKSSYKQAMLTECLSASLKGIYISGLDRAMPLTEENIKLSESLVDRFIEEQGGANVLLRRMSNKTYLLETVRRIVEETEEEVSDTATEEEKDFNELPAENKEKMLDKLEKEDDIDSAVEIIANRISSAEEEFIKKNAEDKEKVETIINNINDRIQAVKADAETSDEVKEEVEKEAAVECKRKINDVYYNRRHTIFEHMVTEMASCIMKDEELKRSYTTEDGKLDMDRVIGNVKCMYGFLEFVNSTQLVKVDEEYIENMLKEM